AACNWARSAGSRARSRTVMRTSYPACSNSSTHQLPMNPDPPVTNPVVTMSPPKPETALLQGHSRDTRADRVHRGFVRHALPVVARRVGSGENMDVLIGQLDVQ